jgi:hypothetical protein
MNVIHDCLVFAATNTGAGKNDEKKKRFVFFSFIRIDHVRRNIESFEIS